MSAIKHSVSDTNDYVIFLVIVSSEAMNEVVCFNIRFKLIGRVKFAALEPATMMPLSVSR